MDSVYSFGEQSPLKFTIPDKLADNYNAAAREFFNDQQRFSQKFGRQWDPTKDPISIKWSRAQKDAWNEFAKIFDKTIAEVGPVHVSAIMDDFLVKNVTVTALAAALKWKRVIAAVALSGAVYELLRRR